MLKNGAYTALVTPFDEKSQVNIPMLRDLIRFQLREGIQGLVVLGTTGEAPTLKPEEKDCIIQIAVEEVKGKIPLIVGTGAYSTAAAIENTKRAEALGADMALVVTPYYNKPTPEGIFLHYQEITKHTSLPIIIYNIQGRTACNINSLHLKRLASLETIIGIKESSGNIEQMTEMIDCILSERPDFKIFSGDDLFTLPLIALGGHGVVSVVSNLLPKPIVQLVEAGLKGDFTAARKLHYELLPITKGAFIETNPLPIKEAMNLCGKAVGGYRLPLCEMLPHNKQALRQILQQMQLL
jgi:4-hydroxy-tetrahydrodipicolinate synthase